MNRNTKVVASHLCQNKVLTLWQRTLRKPTALKFPLSRKEITFEIYLISKLFLLDSNKNKWHILFKKRYQWCLKLCSDQILQSKFRDFNFLSYAIRIYFELRTELQVIWAIKDQLQLDIFRIRSINWSQDLTFQLGSVILWRNLQISNCTH